MNAIEIPPAIRLIASIARLIDFHQARRDGGIYRPQVPDSAGRYLSMALQMLDVVRRAEIRGNRAVSISEIVAEMPQYTREDLCFCAENLSAMRTIAWESDEQVHRTETTTNLLLLHAGEQIELTDNARMFLRIADSPDAWLYADADAQRLEAAIRRKRWGDIPAMCASMVLDMANRSNQLTGVMERVGGSGVRDFLVSEGSNIIDSMNNADVITRRAIDLLKSDTVALDVTEAGCGFASSNLIAEVQHVVACVEALARRFREFLQQAMDERKAVSATVDFLSIADRMVLVDWSDKQLKAMTQSLMPARSQISMHTHPLRWIGRDDLVDDDYTTPTVESSTTVEESLHTFLDTHGDLLRERIEQGGALCWRDFLEMEFRCPFETLLEHFSIFGDNNAIVGSRLDIETGLPVTAVHVIQQTGLFGHNPRFVVGKDST